MPALWALCACAPLKSAFSAAPNRWPASRDHRVRRDGALLRVYGGSFQTPALAAADAREALRRYLLTLDLPGEAPERAARVRAALEAFPAAPARAAAREGHAAVLEIELSRLQALLGTRYE